MSNNTVHQLRKEGYKVSVNHRRRYFDTINKRWVYLTGYEYSLLNNQYLNGPSAVGGYTYISVTDPNGNESTAESRCSNKENFCKKAGVKIALERLDAVWTEAIKLM